MVDQLNRRIATVAGKIFRRQEESIKATTI